MMMSAHSRRFFRRSFGLIPLLLLGLPSGAFPAGSPQSATNSAIRLVRSSTLEAVVEIEAPAPEVRSRGPGEAAYFLEGWGRTYDQGAPELPATGFQLALPPGTRPELSVRVLSVSAVDGAAPAPVPGCRIYEGGEEPPAQEVVHQREESFYRSEYPAVWARLTGEGGLRHLRVVGVEAFPFHWDPAAQVVRRARLEVTVRFLPEQGTEKRSALRQEIPGRDGAMWDRIYARSVLNAEQAAAFRRSPAAFRAAGGPKSLRAGRVLRIEVDRTGLCRLPYDSLLARGWDEVDTPIERLALTERFFVEGDAENPFHEEPVPIRVLDYDGDGLFNGAHDDFEGDEIVFFASTIWDDPLYRRHHATAHPTPSERRYGRGNSYFLTSLPEGGARMLPGGASFLGREDLTPDSSFAWTQHFEEEYVYMAPAAVGRIGDGYEGDKPGQIGSGVNAITNEHFFWVGGSTPTTDFHNLYPVPFALPGLLEPLGLRLEFHGITRLDSGLGPDARVSFWFVRGPGDSLAAPWPAIEVRDRSRKQKDLTGAELLQVPWKAGENLLLMQMPDSNAGAALDWMDFSWRRNYAAYQNQVAWTSESLSGPQEFKLTGFNLAGGDSLLLFEVTDSSLVAPPGEPVRGPRVFQIDGAAQFTGPLRERTARFQFNLDGTPRTFIAASRLSIPLPARIEPVSDVDLTSPEGAEEEMIVLSAPEFLEGILPLVQQRRSEGLSVRLVSIRDVYDQFEGGRAWPTAIRGYLRYLFRTRTVDPSFLLLVGDASDAFGRKLFDFAYGASTADPDFVPTQTLFSWAYSDQGSELVASDEWLVDNLTGTGEDLDFRPDMAVGRLPVGNAAELDAVVNKLLNYGHFAPTDAWRNRGLFVSDDDFSNRIGFRGNYRFHGDPYAWMGDESIFRWAGRVSQKKIRRDAGFSEFVADSFFVAAYMDTVPGLERCCEWESRHCAMDSVQSWHLRCYNNADNLPYFEDDGYNHPLSDNKYYGDRIVRPKLKDAMNRGYLFVSYQGHANAHLMSHEYIFVDQRFNPPYDPLELRNENRPFVFMGFGCHLAEFSASDEGLPHRGDSISERLLFQDQGRGAVAAYASTGYEWLIDNELPNFYMIDGWFLSPPQVDGKTRWLLGEVMTQGKDLMLAAQPGDPSRKGPIATYTLLGDPAMPMEMAPPRLRVELNGSPWSEGNPVVAEAGSDTARIRVTLKDEVHLAGISLFDDGLPVADSLYTVAQADSSAPGADRRLVLQYNPRLYPSSAGYVIEVRARDSNGQENMVRLAVDTEVRFYLWHDGRTDAINPGDFVEGGDTLLVTLASPVDLAEQSLELRLGDSPLPGRSVESTDPRHWEIRGVLPEEIPSGSQSIVLSIDRSDGGTATPSITIRGAGEAGLSGVYNFPNPFGEETRIYYTLSGTAARARVSIYTQSGRKIWQAEGPALARENSILWNGLDSAGDPVANGLYFYKLEIRTLDGKNLSRIERIARVR